jgi:hypothetical protein
MKAWTCTDFQGHWPVPTAAVIVAETARRAAQLLNRELVRNNLPRGVTSKSMKEIDLSKENAVILSDGQY